MKQKRYSRPAGKIQRSFDLSPGLAHRLKVLAAQCMESQSAIVERAIRKELERMERAWRLNRVIQEVFAEAGAVWAPETGDGLWVEVREDGLYLCDHNVASRLADDEATEDYVERAAREWLQATGSLPTPPAKVRLTGWNAIRYAESHPDAVLCHYATPIEDARTGVDIETAREIARDDASLVYCDVPREVVEDEFRRVFGREATVLETRRDNTQVLVAVDGWPEPAWYDAGRALDVLNDWEDGAGEEDGDADVCRDLEERGAFLGFRVGAGA